MGFNLLPFKVALILVFKELARPDPFLIGNGANKKASLVRGVMPADLGLSFQSNTGYASASSRKLNTEGSYAEAKSKMQSKQWFEQFLRMSNVMPV